MVCGIASLVSSCLCPCIGIIVGGVAIGLAFQANAEITRGVVSASEKPKVITGWVCGGVALLLAILNAILGVVIQLGGGNFPH